MASIADDIKRSFTDGSALTRIIYINLGVFVLGRLILSFSSLGGATFSITPYLATVADLPTLVTKPWTLITYMFYHEGFLHILFNMLYLYFAGRIFQDLLGEKRLISLYIMGGLFGAFFYIFMYNVLPVFQDGLKLPALGASAAVLSIIAAIATKVPNYQLHLVFLGPVKLKYIALVLVVLDLISFHDGNAGGHLAHLGGAFFGFMYIRQMEKGRDWSMWYYKWTGAIKEVFRPSNKKKIKVVYKNNEGKKKTSSNVNEQEMVDKILDKISKSGYDSLSKEEKDILFRASQKN